MGAEGMILGVLFDIGGVLVVLDGMPSLAKYLGTDERVEELHRKWMNSPFVVGHETGRIGAAEFAAGVVEELRLQVSAEAFLEEFARWPDSIAPGALQLIDDIPSTYRVAALSNTSAVHWERITAMGLGGRFERSYLSHETGHLKPSPEAFHVALWDMGLEPAEALFLDDHPANVDAARALGLKAEVVQSPRGARSVLEAYGVIPDRA